MLGISAALCPLMSVSSISSSPLALKDSWVIEKKISWALFFLILLTLPLSIITPGSSILRTFVSLICGDTGILLVTLKWGRAAWFCLELGAAFLEVSVFSVCPRYRSILQASCCCKYWSECLNESLNSSSSTSSDQHHCQALSQAFRMWVNYQTLCCPISI